MRPSRTIMVRRFKSLMPSTSKVGKRNASHKANPASLQHFKWRVNAVNHLTLIFRRLRT